MTTPTDENTRYEGTLDPALMAVLANRFEVIVREMTNTILRAGRSAVIAVARDFSCSIVTGDDRLLAAAEGLPIHSFGTHLQTASMRELHPDLREGDAFLDNDPYVGNTHAADHTILAPVFVDGEHVFTACAKAHQADCGNAIPSTYHPLARDVYEEGALIFPSVQIQRDYEDLPDVIRMCRRRIRVPEQWYGDYLATLGSARIAERRIHGIAAKYGMDTLRVFVDEWLDYSERRMMRAIERLPAKTVVGFSKHDAVGPLTEGIPLQARVTVDPEAAYIDVDLTENVDCVPAGLNESQACSINIVTTGVLNALEPGIPVNEGAFRRIRIHLRENCVVGIPLHPTSCSLATTDVADRMMNIIQHSFAELGEGFGLAEGGAVIGAGFAVISGHDLDSGRPYINQLIVGANGGPATPGEDGWVTYNAPAGAGLIYRDSIEVDEHKYPILYRSVRIEPDSGGAGTYRGAPGTTVEYGPTRGTMVSAYSLDGYETPARGARGGLPGGLGSVVKVAADGTESPAPNQAQLALEPGEFLRGMHGGGGGYGSPLARDPRRVLADVLDGYVSAAAAHDVYGVVLTGDRDRPPTIDEAATSARRDALASSRTSRAEQVIGRLSVSSPRAGRAEAHAATTGRAI